MEKGLLVSHKALILANGTLEQVGAIQQRLLDWQGAWILAADGGSRYATALGLTIDVLIGDLDSIDGATQQTLQTSGIRLENVPAQKDEIDLELALLHAVEHGAQQIAVIGAVGGRLDMTVANILLLMHPRLVSARVEFWHGAQTAWLIHPPGEEIHGQPGDTLSLIPLGGDADGVTTYHLQYPLQNEKLAYGPARGVSNVFLTDTARVDMRSGKLLAVHTPRQP